LPYSQISREERGRERGRWREYEERRSGSGRGGGEELKRVQSKLRWVRLGLLEIKSAKAKSPSLDMAELKAGTIGGWKVRGVGTNKILELFKFFFIYKPEPTFRRVSVVLFCSACAIALTPVSIMRLSGVLHYKKKKKKKRSKRREINTQKRKKKR
jgi:hypothetical protein